MTHSPILYNTNSKKFVEEREPSDGLLDAASPAFSGLLAHVKA